MQTTNARKKPPSLHPATPRAARRQTPDGVKNPNTPVQDAAYYRAMADGYFSYWFEGDA